jgi:glucose-1-phosphatase
MIEGIKHIIFDLGGVLLNIDYKRTEQAFVEAGIADFPQLYSQLQQTELFDRFETGRISSEEFIMALRAIAPPTVTAEQIVAAWNAMILDYPLRRLQLLQQLRLYYDLVLLSNTNELHEHAFNTLLSRTHGMPTIAVFFDKVYLSHRVGMRKPDVALFRRVLDECGFKPEETLFIDDSPQHIEGARQAGIRTILLEKGMTIEDNIFLAKEK